MNINYKIVISLLTLGAPTNYIKSSSAQDLREQILALKKKNAQQTQTIQDLKEQNAQLTAALATAERDKKTFQNNLFKQTTNPTYHS